jgi:hypothetical protein
MPFQDIVFDFSEEKLSNITKGGKPAKFLCRYLKELKAKTFVVEDFYIDKDYLIDYQKFYSRSFNAPERHTQRIHFFDQSLKYSDIERIVTEAKEEEITVLKKSYLGFIVVKPITDDQGNNLIGRTVLKTYSNDDGEKQRFYLKTKHNVSFFGIDLEVESIPFQEQDKGVSACATIALWTAFNALQPLLKLQEKAPAEITEVSTRLPTEARIFPQGGLSIQQMITCIRSAELDVEIIGELDQETIVTAVKAYIDGGIPLIADLEMTLKEKYRTPTVSAEFHAAVITGYRCNAKGNLIGLYVHDDQIGPYCSTKPIDNFTLWQNEWLSIESKFEKVRLEKLIIPVYHKIRLSWLEIYDFHKRYEQDAAGMECEVELFLTTTQRYKNFLRGKDIVDKADKLLYSLPRYIWVERFHRSNHPDALLFDHIFDGTNIHPKVELDITYVTKAEEEKAIQADTPANKQ